MSKRQMCVMHLGNAGSTVAMVPTDEACRVERQCPDAIERLAFNADSTCEHCGTLGAYIIPIGGGVAMGCEPCTMAGRVL